MVTGWHFRSQRQPFIAGWGWLLVLGPGLAFGQPAPVADRSLQPDEASIRGAPDHAVCDGRVDDHDALQAALTSGKLVQIPAGLCVSASPITVTGHAVSLRGAGAGLSTILFTGPGDGLVIANTRQDQPVQINDLSLTTTRQEPGTALSVTFTGLDLNHYGEYALGSIRGLSIGGRDFGSSGWARGIHVQDFANAVIVENDVIGRRDIALATPASFQHMTMGIEVTGAGPIDVTTLHLMRNKVFSAATCMQDDGAIEGVEYLSNVVVGCGAGFVTMRSGQRPYVRYQGNHANVFTAGIAISNAPQSWVSDNLIYKNEHSTGLTQAIALEASG